MSEKAANGKTVIMDRIKKAREKAASGPLSDARERPTFERIAALSPFPPEAALEDYVQRFKTELEALSSKAYGPFDVEEAAETVLRLVQERGTFKVVAWDEDQIGCDPIGDKLERASIRMIPGNVPNDREHQVVLEQLAEIEVGITGATAGLADTGSIVVTSGPGRARIASLLPPIHIAILKTSRIFPTMQEWLSAEGTGMIRESANLVVITGGSRTSDIELQLTLGMHGPKELHVVLLHDQ